MLSFKKLSTKELILLFTGLHYMVASGITLRSGVDIMLQNKHNRINKRSLETLIDGFDEGLAFSQILQQNEDIFGIGLWRQVAAAESSGKVPECLERIAKQLKDSGKLYAKLKSAMAYPIFVLVLAFGVTYYLFTTSIPEMGKMLEEFGVELPLVTQIVMAFCDFVIDYGILVILAIALIIVMIIRILRGPLNVPWCKLIVKTPIIGKVSVNVNYSLVFILINDMLENGTHIVEALRVAASSATNVYIRNDLFSCADVMEKEGLGISAALKDSVTMPSDDILMLSVGAQTGRELEILTDLSGRRRSEADESIERMLAIMPPLLTVGVGLIVGLVLLSVYMPMFSLAMSMT